jgi:anti-sigma regulatory factor (Ser/Thr protein kinase)/anti-anti-sigma regulatory factor
MTTAIFGLLDPSAPTFRYATAGHPAPIVATAEQVQTLPAGGVPLGFMEGRTAPSWTVDLSPGSLLVLYTDGLIEHSHDPSAGLAALLSAVDHQFRERSTTPAHGILKRIVTEGKAPDDIALVTVRLDPASVDRLDMALLAQPSSLRVVRNALQQLTKALHLDEHRAFALTVAVGEAVNNVIEHAYGASIGILYLRARRDGDTLRVEIEDRGRWRPDQPENHGGRGLTLMRALADTVEVVSTPDGTTIKITISLAGMPSAMEEQTRGPEEPQPRDPAADLSLRTVAQGTILHRSDDEAASSITQVINGVSVVEILEDVDLTNVGQFTTTLEDAVATTQGPVVLSFGAASYFDSQGMQALLKVGRRLGTTRRTLRLVVPHASPLRHVLNSVDVGSMFPLFESVEQAFAAVEGSEPTT